MKRTHQFFRQGFFKFEYFGHLKTGSDVFFDADSKSIYNTPCLICLIALSLTYCIIY